MLHQRSWAQLQRSLVFIVSRYRLVDGGEIPDPPKLSFGDLGEIPACVPGTAPFTSI